MMKFCKTRAWITLAVVWRARHSKNFPKGHNTLYPLQGWLQAGCNSNARQRSQRNHGPCPAPLPQEELVSCWEMHTPASSRGGRGLPDTFSCSSSLTCCWALCFAPFLKAAVVPPRVMRCLYPTTAFSISGQPRYKHPRDRSIHRVKVTLTPYTSIQPFPPQQSAGSLIN